MATKANLVIDQGTTYATTITMQDEDGTVLDLTNYTGVAQLRKHYSSVSKTDFTVDLGGNTGTITLGMSANATANLIAGRYVYDVELTSTVTDEVFRILEGIVTITPNVTR